MASEEEKMQGILETVDQQEMVGICGRNDEFLRIIRGAFDCTIVARGNQISMSGHAEEVALLEQLLQELLFLYRQGLPLTTHDVRYSMYMVKAGKLESLHRMYADTIIVNNRGRQVKAKTLGQWQYVETIRHNYITLGIGPAGTGKTYRAVALAVAALKKKEVERIILTRPAVEAGEKLGFLPGDMQDKVDPYLRPLYDGLYDMLGTETFQKYLTKGTIEVAPLAYMRGRTLNDAFIILDEAQSSSAVWKRAAGSFCMHLRMMASSDGSTLGLSCEGGMGCSLTCLSATEMASSPLKGTWPVADSYITMPRE